MGLFDLFKPKKKKTKMKKKKSSVANSSTPTVKKKTKTQKYGLKRKSGFVETKKNTHGIKRHPALYRRKKRHSDEIDYVTFTHSKQVEIDNQTIETIELTSNIDPNERGIKKSHVVPIVYEGKRSNLGKEIEGLSLIDEDKSIVDKVFDEAPRRPIPKKKRQ